MTAHTKRVAPENLFDKLKVEDLTLYNSPVEDRGAALVFKFEQDVDICDDTLAFPLSEEQMFRLWRLANGWAAQHRLIDIHRGQSLVKLPHEL